MPSVRPLSVISLLIEAYAQGTYQALPSTNTASFGTPREDYGLVSGWWLGLQTFVHDIWRPATNAPITMVLLFTFTLSKRDFPVPYNPLIPLTSLPLCAHSLCHCLLFGIPVPYLPLAALKTTRSHRGDFATVKYTGECLIGPSSL